MLSSIASSRRSGEPLACAPRHSAGRRSRTLCLTAVLALAAAAAPSLLWSDAARAQSEQPIPPSLQQPLPVQPGQPPAQQPPAQQQQAPQPGADAQASAKKFGDWTQNCTTNPPPIASPPKPGQQEVCFLVQDVLGKDGKNIVLKITVGFFGPQRQAGAFVAVPLGVPLARGLQLVIDGKAVNPVPFEVCDRLGCQTRVALTDEIVAAMKAGTQAVATMQSIEGQTARVPISLAGFTAGFNAIQ